MNLLPHELQEVVRASIISHEPLLIVGPPGIGKTDIVSHGALMAGARLICKHGVTEDPTDSKGMPWITGTNGTARADFVPFGDLRVLIETQEPTVCFFDDAGQAPALVQASWMQMVQSRCIGTHQISPHVSFVAATNRKSDKAGVTGLLEPVKSRFTIVELIPDVDDWCKWALGANVAIEVVAFVRFRPEVITDYKPSADLTNTASPRTLHKAAGWITRGLSPKAEMAVLAGCIGEGRAAELVGFLKVWRSLPNIDQILLNPKTAPIPEGEPATLYALSGLLARRATAGNFGAMVQYVARLPKEHQILTMKMATTKAPDVMQTQGYINWSVNNQDVLM